MNIRETAELLEEQVLSPLRFSEQEQPGGGTGRRNPAISGRPTRGIGIGFSTASRSAD